MPGSLIHKVTEKENKLGVGESLPGLRPEDINNIDLYAVQKELYLGSLCEVKDTPRPWQFWMIMLKNGNYDTRSGLCPQDGKRVPPFKPGRFPCFGTGCMNQPILCHQWTKLEGDVMRGGFNGTYDLDSSCRDSGLDDNNNISFYEVVWEKKVNVGSWLFKHKLKTSKKYPWLMLYLRADTVSGFSGGYHYDTRGMLKAVSSEHFLQNPMFQIFQFYYYFFFKIMRNVSKVSRLIIKHFPSLFCSILISIDVFCLD